MNLSSKTVILLLALVCFAKSHYEDATCDHHQVQAESPPEFLDIEEDFRVLKEGRTLESNPNIRIYADYSNLLSTSTSSYTSYVEKDLAPAVISYFESALKVKYPVAGKLKLDSSVSSVCGMNVPSVFKNSGVDADYAIFFTSKSQSNTVVASSKYCYLASGSKRPLFATTSFNRQVFLEAKGDVILHEKNTYLLLHEMTHTFGFSPSMYNYFLDSNGNRLSGHVKTMTIAGNKHTVVDVAPLTERLRKFHGCSSIPGAILENNGGSGTDSSHLEKKFYMYETMATGSMSGKRTSEFSLAMLEGSGWYEVDYSYAEPYWFGQGQGCDFINGKCNSNQASFDEFCGDSNRGCAFMGHSGGKCRSDQKTQGCKFILPDNDFHCESQDGEDYARFPDLEVYGRGSGSRCFSGDLNSRKSSNGASSFCFKYNCVGSGSDTQLEILIGRDTLVCDRAGEKTLDGYYGSINCPDPNHFCSTAGKRYCPRNCMGRGSCVDNKCQCNSGFTGVDCALRA